MAVQRVEAGQHPSGWRHRYDGSRSNIYEPCLGKHSSQFSGRQQYGILVDVAGLDDMRV
jgi:hypothetical protein